jgi:protein-tyrosine phosphatase
MYNHAFIDRTANGLRLSGAPNFREVCRYETAGGGTIRPGSLFRSDSLARVTADDVELLDGLRIGSLIDLRSDRERAAHPNRWPSRDSVATLHLDISNDLRASEGMLNRILAENLSARGAREVMRETYRRMPRAFVGRLNHVFDRLLVGKPVLVHCTAGKDRTGFVTAMIMSALGAKRDAIYDEYMLTTKQCDVRQIAAGSVKAIAAAIGRPELDFDFAVVLSDVSPDYLDLSYSAIDEEFGSLDSYLHTAGGLDAAKRTQLKRLLLD